jgi:hypothetical protein
MASGTRRSSRQDIEREIDERATDEVRQRSGSTPTEDLLERALEDEPDHEPGVEWHAGEDAGEVPRRDDDEGDAPGSGPPPA